MKIKIFVNNPWQENTIVLYNDKGEAIVIDCGCFSEQESNELKTFFENNNLKPVLLLNTHLHIDHIFGNKYMEDTYGLLARSYETDAFWIERLDEYSAMFGIHDMEKPILGDYLKDGEKIPFGESEIEVIHIGGHSPGCVCFYSEKDKLLISGDVLFQNGIGRTDLPGGDTQELLRGIRNKLFILPDEVKVIPGHGPSTTIGDEKRDNPYCGYM